MREDARSEQACPVCSQHTLALDEPPQIDVMGVQSYLDLLGMGDLRTASTLGIVCLTCGTRWHDKDAFDRGEPLPDEPDDEAAEEDALAEEIWEDEGGAIDEDAPAEDDDPAEDASWVDDAAWADDTAR